MGYIMDLRKELPNPHRPLIMCSAGIIIIDKNATTVTMNFLIYITYYKY